jgi:integrase
VAFGQRDPHNPNGWRARFLRPDKSYGTQSGFTSRTAAKKWGEEQEALIKRRLWIDPRDAETPFEIVTEKWHDAFRKRLARGTLAKYRSQLDNHIIPQWGTWPSIAIFNGYADIQEWVSELHEDYEESTVCSIFALFSTVLNFAVNDKLIPANPCSAIKVTTGEFEAERLIATPVQVLRAAMRLYRTSMGLAGFVLCLLDAYTGARWSELVGQQRHEYNDMARAITIREPLNEVNGAVSKGGRSVAADAAPEPMPVPSGRRPRRPKKDARPKTPAGRRDVELPPSIATFYEMLMKDHEHPFVICTPEGRPLRRSNFRQRYWRPAWDGVEPDRPDAAGHIPAILPWFTFHEGRHTQATWLIEGGVPEVGRRARLGQKMKGMARVYDHVTPEIRARILEFLEELWFASLVALTAAERLQLGEWFPHLTPALEEAAAEAKRSSPHFRHMILSEHEKRPTKIVGRSSHQRI